MIMTKTILKDLVYEVNSAAIEVHKALGPGLLESLTHKCMKRELQHLGIGFLSELSVPVNYKGIEVDTELRCDLFIENILVVELKAVVKKNNRSFTLVNLTIIFFNTPRN